MLAPRLTSPVAMTRPVLAPARRVHDMVRHRAALALRSKVAGEHATQRASAIWGAEGARWFTPEDPIWRVHLDASMFLGGIRALLLQSLHPLAMAGVDQHSRYRDDPWGRLQQTSGYLSTTTFGTIQDAERLIARIRGMHRRVRGTADDGRPYAASDPHLLTWVHVAETESFLTCYQTYGVSRLSAYDADRYVAQTGSVAARLGVIDPPQTVTELTTALERFTGELAGTPAARETLRFIATEPPMPLAVRPGYLTLVAGALGTLPADARRMLGVRLLPGGAVPLRGAGQVGVGLIRWMLSDPLVRTDRRQSA
ncbi:oxygenase MpaB family protein [Branchiibius hedensis]|nr:oxygenase MpaB family protein [Branchiibius hedensis]